MKCSDTILPLGETNCKKVFIEQRLSNGEHITIEDKSGATIKGIIVSSKMLKDGKIRYKIKKDNE